MFRILFLVGIFFLGRAIYRAFSCRECKKCGNTMPNRARMCPVCRTPVYQKSTKSYKLTKKMQEIKKHVPDGEPLPSMDIKRVILDGKRMKIIAVAFVVACIPTVPWYVDRVANTFVEYKMPMYLIQFDRDVGNVIIPALRDNETREALTPFAKAIGFDYVFTTAYDFDPVGELFRVFGHPFYPSEWVNDTYNSPTIVTISPYMWPAKYQGNHALDLWEPSDVRARLKSFGLDISPANAKTYKNRWSIWWQPGIWFGLYSGMFVSILLLIGFTIFRLPFNPETIRMAETRRAFYKDPIRFISRRLAKRK